MVEPQGSLIPRWTSQSQPAAPPWQKQRCMILLAPPLLPSHVPFSIFHFPLLPGYIAHHTSTSLNISITQKHSLHGGAALTWCCGCSNTGVEDVDRIGISADIHTSESYRTRRCASTPYPPYVRILINALWIAVLSLWIRRGRGRVELSTSAAGLVWSGLVHHLG